MKRIASSMRSAWNETVFHARRTAWGQFYEWATVKVSDHTWDEVRILFWVHTIQDIRDSVHENLSNT